MYLVLLMTFTHYVMTNKFYSLMHLHLHMYCKKNSEYCSLHINATLWLFQYQSHHCGIDRSIPQWCLQVNGSTV